jgi:hypothetical protein
MHSLLSVTTPMGRGRWAIADGYIHRDDPAAIPRNTDSASLIESEVPIVVQHLRLDSRQAENALITTIAHADRE